MQHIETAQPLTLCQILWSKSSNLAERNGTASQCSFQSRAQPPTTTGLLPPHPHAHTCSLVVLLDTLPCSAPEWAQYQRTPLGSGTSTEAAPDEVTGLTRMEGPAMKASSTEKVSVKWGGGGEVTQFPGRGVGMVSEGGGGMMYAERGEGITGVVAAHFHFSTSALLPFPSLLLTSPHPLTLVVGELVPQWAQHGLPARVGMPEQGVDVGQQSIPGRGGATVGEGSHRSAALM